MSRHGKTLRSLLMTLLGKLSIYILSLQAASAGPLVMKFGLDMVCFYLVLKLHLRLRFREVRLSHHYGWDQ